MTTDHLLETETTGISCQNRFKSQRVAFDLPLPGDCQSGEAWMLVQSCGISVTIGEGFRWLPSTSSNQDLWVRRINWLKEGFPFHTLIHIAQWAVPFYVTRWRVWVCDLVTSNRMIIEKKGLSMVSQHITTNSSWLQVHTVDQTVLPPPSIALLASVCLMAAGPLLLL